MLIQLYGHLAEHVGGGKGSGRGITRQGTSSPLQPKNGFQQVSDANHMRGSDINDDRLETALFFSPICLKSPSRSF